MNFLHCPPEGVYNVSVTASNPLGNVSTVPLRFYVQTAPANCRLHHDGPYHVAFGDEFHVNVTTSAGSDVMIDWDMGDQTEYKNKSKYHTVYSVQPGRRW